MNDIIQGLKPIIAVLILIGVMELIVYFIFPLIDKIKEQFLKDKGEDND